jgi:hypothetical protein
MTCFLALMGLVIVGLVAAWCWARQKARNKRDVRHAYSYGRAAALASMRDNIAACAGLVPDAAVDPHANLAQVHERHQLAAEAQDRLHQTERREAARLAQQLGLGSGGYLEADEAAPLFRSAPPPYSLAGYHAAGGELSGGYAALLRRDQVSLRLVLLIAMWVNILLNCPFSPL